jgi:transcriptional regulator with XRE-family HTH domain
VIGARLQNLRKQHRYSLRRLAESAGVSASLVSDIERGRVEPSISTLKALSGALGTTLAFFFTETKDLTGRVVSATQRDVIGGDGAPGGHAARRAIDTAGVRFELASPPDSEAIEAVYGRYDVGASLGDAISHEGEEWGMVLTGRLKVWVGDEIHFLDPGDSIGFPSTIPHRMENVADGPTEYIWINTPKLFWPAAVPPDA